MIRKPNMKFFLLSSVSASGLFVPPDPIEVSANNFYAVTGPRIDKANVFANNFYVATGTHHDKINVIANNIYLVLGPEPAP